MTVVLAVTYLAGWLVTTVLLLRRDPGSDGHPHRALLGLVGAGCAVALAAVWPLTAWVLPAIRAALDNPEG
jgi:hypothetical protein